MVLKFLAGRSLGGDRCYHKQIVRGLFASVLVCPVQGAGTSDVRCMSVAGVFHL